MWETMANDEIKVKSLKKAIEVLNCFTEKENWGITEISEKLGLYKSNVHNILSTYKAMGYVNQNPETGLYRLDVGIFKLSRALGMQYKIAKVALPYMQALSNKVQENVFLAIPRDDVALYMEATYPMGCTSMIREMLGMEAKMYCTGLGKAMMAYLPKNLQEEYASRPLEAYTENTITDKETLLEELRQTRIRGYALDNMEHEFGVKCIAVPILNMDGQVIAGLSITGRASEIDWKRENERILLKLKECALSIQDSM